MTPFNTTAADLFEPESSTGIFAALRRRAREATLRYLRWRSVSQLRQLDPHTLKDFEVHVQEILSSALGLRLDDAHCGTPRAESGGRPAAACRVSKDTR